MQYLILKLLPLIASTTYITINIDINNCVLLKAGLERLAEGDDMQADHNNFRRPD